MTDEEARWILKFHRPDRPRSTDRRQLQKAIDVILDEGEWIANPLGDYVCNKCSWVVGKFERNFCPNCGKKMKHLS